MKFTAKIKMQQGETAEDAIKREIRADRIVIAANGGISAYRSDGYYAARLPIANCDVRFGGKGLALPSVFTLKFDSNADYGID